MEDQGFLDLVGATNLIPERGDVRKQRRERGAGVTPQVRERGLPPSPAQDGPGSKGRSGPGSKGRRFSFAWSRWRRETG